jgi:hypothetical protein
MMSGVIALCDLTMTNLNNRPDQGLSRIFPIEFEKINGLMLKNAPIILGVGN